MRILVLNWNPDIVGGAEQYLKTVMPALVAAGDELALIHGYEPAGAQPKIAPEGVPAWCVESLGVPEVLRRVTAWAPDLVWVHMNDSRELESELCRLYPAVFFAHTYDLTCPTGMKTRKLPVPEACDRRAGAACLALHYWKRCGGLHPLTAIRGLVRQQQRLAEAVAYQGFLVASEHMRSELVKHGIPADKVHVASLFPPGMEPDSGAPAPRPFTGNVLFVGRLVFVKGAEQAIRGLCAANSRLGRRMCLTIAGDGGEKEALAAIARAVDIPVRFAGWLNLQDRLELMRSSDLLLVPSVWPEPFGLVGIEAGCVGLPAAAYATGGIVDWLIPGQSGELAPAHPPTVEGLADAIFRALEDAERHQQLRIGAWQNAHRFSLGRHIERLEQVFSAYAAQQVLP